MRFLSNFGCKISFMSSVKFWQQRDYNSLFKGSIGHVTYNNGLGGRCGRKNCDISQEDLYAMEEEANFDNARQDILSSFEGKHPIVLDQSKICELTGSGELKKMKLGLLQHI